MEEKQEFVGYLIGGPEDGKLISSETNTIHHESVYSNYPRVTIKGKYVWLPSVEYFIWESQL